MKLLTFLDLAQKMQLIFKIMYWNSQIDSIVFEPETLSSGTRYSLTTSMDSMNLEVDVSTGFHVLVNLHYQPEIHSSLRDDNYLKITTAYNNVLGYGIYREHSHVLYKAPNTFPQLPYDQCFDEDVLEPLMFQLMTKYTENEVQSMVAVRYLCPYYEVEDKCEHHPFPLIGLDLRALSFLSSKDVEELNEFITGVYNDVLRYTEVRVDEGSTD